MGGKWSSSFDWARVVRDLFLTCSSKKKVYRPAHGVFCEELVPSSNGPQSEAYDTRAVGILERGAPKAERVFGGQIGMLI
ncbi:unnamed protein product [Mycena citricolor]|uniref:Uncharacterized protein n=1 Tax=Mycena citricolor TaxID=2018698 RepID=A0AAD2HSK4_9AGAR|nr:unnamed protein product [Mycena citricolor]